MPRSRHTPAVVAGALGLLASGGAARPLAAQPPAPLPVYESLNPAVAARSGVYLQPLVPVAPAGWQLGARLEYGSAIERALNFPDRYLLDAELWRVQVGARRDLRGGRAFVQVVGGLAGTQAGFADAFFEDYHRLIRWVMEERDARPRNAYGHEVSIRALGVDERRAARAVAPTDIRLNVGVRHTARSQTVLSLTAPTAPPSSAFARRVPTVSLLHARDAEPRDGLTLEGTAGVGYAPRTGALAPLQRTLLYAVSAGGRLRTTGTQALFARLYYHVSPFRGTGFPELDVGELSVDFGYLWHTGAGRSWRVGLTEDTRRRDAGIDLVLRVSVE
ncbi:MAG TPA: hypothetical protein VFS08_09980 [Gemmatimonadaceae bacterium]|nr:hypothetical protein [Gemmatimonadaceae bacterium]